MLTSGSVTISTKSRPGGSIRLEATADSVELAGAGLIRLTPVEADELANQLNEAAKFARCRATEKIYREAFSVVFGHSKPKVING